MILKELMIFFCEFSVNKKSTCKYWFAEIFEVFGIKWFIILRKIIGNKY